MRAHAYSPSNMYNAHTHAFPIMQQIDRGKHLTSRGWERRGGGKEGRNIPK